MPLGVCILTFESEQFIIKCVSSVLAALQGSPHHIVIVDNHSTDRSVAVVRQAFPDLPVIVNASNLGYARGNNVGAKYLITMGCDYLAFLNPDVLVNRDTLHNLQAALLNAPSAGCVGGVVPGLKPFRHKPEFLDFLLLDGSLRYVPFVRRLLNPLVQIRSSANYIALSDKPDQSAIPVYSVSGACIMLPVTAFTTINGFDEGTFLYAEEFIMSERLRSAGLQVCGVPYAKYEHTCSHSTGKRELLSRYTQAKSEYYLTRQYYRWPIMKSAVLFFVQCTSALVLVAVRLVGRGVSRLRNSAARARP